MANEEKLREYLKLVTADLQSARRQLRELSDRTPEPIAVVGIGCRYPGGVRGPDDLWRLVAEGTDAIDDFPVDRGWDMDSIYDASAPDEATTRTGGFLDGVADFDAAFFDTSPREALAMDPQQRLTMEVAWEALEHAGIPPRSLHGTRSGVYVGVYATGYGTILPIDSSEAVGHLITGMATSVLSGRLSFALGLQGPAISMDTACSSSLVSVHLAARALRAGEADLALAGGVTVLPTPTLWAEFSRQQGLAPDGRCKAFSDDADGTGWGEGVGMLVLERLSDARRNGHRVLAVVTGSAVNSDGASNGLTAPNGPAQRRVIEAALESAGLTPADIDAVEAHGTGTALGDPIEAQALMQTYGRSRPDGRPLWLGSLKSNIGHTQAAAGVGGLIKMIMSLRHDTLPATLHVRTPTRHVDWQAGRIQLLTEPVAWPAGQHPRRAAVSGFGISGTNAHVIVEEAPAFEPAEVTATELPAVLTEAPAWLVSARSTDALAAQARALLPHLDTAPAVDLQWSLATSRSPLEHRAVVVGSNPAAGLAALADGLPYADLVTGEAGWTGRTVLVFPGQGGQWLGMGRELAEVSPVFADRLAECCAALAPFTRFAPAEMLAGEHGFDEADIVQPVLWAVMVSLAAVWQAAGVQPDAVLGHSQGEIAAAVVAGALSLEDGARVVALRSRALRALSGRGGMMSIAEPADVVAGRIAAWQGRISVAAKNGPAATVVSGEPDALAELAASCPGVRTRMIGVDYASHSAQVDDLRTEILDALASVAPRPAQLPMLSTLTGQWLEGPELDAGYWFTNLREPVEFAAAVRTLGDAGYRSFVESSPHPVLTAAVADSLLDDAVAIGTLRREDGGAHRLLLSLAEAYAHGLPVDWQTVLTPASTVDLPTYAFQHRRYWPKTAAVTAPADRWRYDVRWTPAALPAGSLHGRWLLVTGTADPSRYADALTAGGADVVLATLPADEAGDREATAARLPDGGFTGVLSLLALDEDLPAGSAGVPVGLLHTLALVQALGDRTIDAPLWLLTEGAVAARSGEQPRPYQAQAWGLGRVVGLEHPDRWGGLVDVGSDADAQALCAVLADGTDDEVALRADGLLVRRLERATPRPGTRPAWTPRGTVLVTGGTGSIGAHLLPWLAEHGARRLVLPTRRGATAATVEAVARLAAAGTGVDVVACDIADADQTAALVAGIENLSTVIHAATAFDLTRLVDTGPDNLALSLGAKVAGAQNLHAATGDLDEFVLFSSIAATWGSNEHAAYGAANAHLDALAQARRAQGLPALSLAWGVWDTRDWDELNAAATGEPGSVSPERLLRQGMRFLPPAGALAEFGNVLADGDGDGYTVVVDMDWDRFVPVFTATRPRPLFDAVVSGPVADEATEPTAPVNELAARLLASPPADRIRQLTELVRSHAAAALGHSDAGEVRANRAFRELGFDSLTAVDLRRRLAAATGLALASSVVFDYPTPTALAQQLLSQLLGAAEPASAQPLATVDPDEPIAIVGIGCRFPGGVDSPEAYWQLLAAGTDAISGFPTDRGWDPDLYDPDPDRQGRSYTRAGGFLHDAAEFDAGFFGISPREALAMDPQQRLLLETSWEALERAGIDPESLHGSATGVFVGAALTGYGADLADGDGGAEGYLVTGNSGSIISGRIAYTLGLEGPAVTIDTACSSSLVALHLAVRALHAGECSLALTAGVMTMATAGQFVGFSRQRGLSPDGRCRAFGAAADGMGLAEGVGVIAVERLSDARRNGHPVLAVVSGIAMNQDGASNGLTAPNGPAQQRVIRAALANAGLRVDDVDAVEAHGTGTTLGDPIEAHALLATYGQDRTRPLWLGSAKSNIGHTQTAAGMAGLIKMVLALQHRELPRTLHAEQPSPEIDWASGNIELLTEARPWESSGIRRAGVSAFGMSGTNVHVIVEEAPAEHQAEAPADTRALRPSATLWPLSARTPQALTAQAARLREFVLARPELDPADIGWSLAADRTAFDHRAVVFGHTRDELLSRLPSADLPAQPQCVVGKPASGKVVFMFPGQGSQWLGMGRELLTGSPVFAARFAECAAALEPYVGWSVTDVLLGADGAPGLDAADVMQPVLWSVMVALAAVWQAAGVQPDAVLGHSQGEIAAAVVAGILSLADGARVVAVRSRALADLDAAGGMVSVVMPVQAVRPLLEPWGDRLAVAAVNGPATTVVSGEADALIEFERELRAQRVMRWRIPATDFVAHSRLVEPIAPVLERELADLSPSAGTVPFFSTVQARLLDGTELDNAYWYANVRRPVRFAESVRALAETGHRVFVEVSAHPVLTAAVTETMTDAGFDAPVVTGTVEREQGGADRFLASVAVLAAHGVDPDWPAVLRGHSVELPTYAFQRSRYWPTAKASQRSAGAPGSAMAERFWHAVESGDAAVLADALELPSPAGLDAVLPALSSWRRRERSDAETADWRHGVAWRPVPDVTPAPMRGSWLVVLPRDEAEHPCLADLRGHGADLVTVALPAQRVDRAGLAGLVSAALAGRPTDELTGVLSLAALDETVETPDTDTTVGMQHTLALTQALGDLDVAAPLWLVTRGAVTGGTELTSLRQAPVWGFGLSAAFELPERWGGLIDLPPTWDDRTGTRLRAVLTALTENQVALRGSGIMARRLVRVPLPPAGERFVPRGTVLITGGTGAIGGHVARWLTSRDAARLVLTSRSGPAADGAVALAARLAQAGSAVEVVACDSGDRDALVALLGRIAATGPALSTVMHAAGALDDGVIDRLSPERLAAAMTGKAAGARYLDELTADLDLDAFVLFSSTSATFGNGGQSNYSAANTYLDALAEQRFAQGRPALSVAWGPWAGGGVGQASEGARQRLARNKWEVLMDPDAAVRALGRAIEDPATPTLTMMAFDLSAVGTDRGVSELLRAPFMAELAAGLGPAESTVDASADLRAELELRLAGRAAAERVRELVTLIRSEAAWVMGYDDPSVIDPTKAFSEMGLDSLTSVELRNRLASATGLTLPATLLFDYPDPGYLAAFLDGELHGSAAEADDLTSTGVTPEAEPLAVVAMGCRFPGGIRNPDQLWAFLDRGGDGITGLPVDRGWDLDGLYDPDPDQPGKAYVRDGGFLTDVADFDAAFFGISPREALAMDPQQRLLLEVTWEALEQGGIDPAGLRGSRTGVFVGGYISGYDQLGSELARTSDGVGLEGHLMTGNATSVLSGRVSYLFGLEGPALTIDTACSSSLVALHSAVSALRAGECDLALAGGVTVMATPRDLIGFSRQRGLAADGRCKAFAAGADGMGMAEGAGMIAVERLSDARRNGHRVLGLIRGSAVNQDGASNGLTAPNGPSQQRVIRAALADAGLSAADVDVVEAHGTGTPLGDPIEAGALLATYGRDRTSPVRLGSVKSNLGHTQAAAGIAGVLKVLLALRHDRLPATLHTAEPSSHIDWSSGALQLLTEPVEWAPSERPRRAGVSAFGMSGTNAHVIIEQPPAEPAVEVCATAPVLTGLTAWPLSARDADALARQAGRLREHILARPELAPADVARSLATTRSRFEHGAVVLGADLSELTAGLTALATGVASENVLTAEATEGHVAFVFPGQGSQWLGMGRELAAASPVFAARLAECGAALEPYVDWTLSDLIAGERELDTADLVQPVLWAVMVSLAEVWQAAGVVPDAVVGHSQGEIAAAVVAGALSLEDGAKVVALRSKALTALAGHGGMLSITEPADAVRARIEPWSTALSLAAVNGPHSCVVSGEPEALRELVEAADRDQVMTKLIDVDYASHSAQVDAIAEEILTLLADVSPRPANRQMVSAMTGELLDGTELGARYWVDSLRAPVEFSRAVRRLADEGYQLFVEASPHPVLRQGIEDTADVVALETLRRDLGDGRQLLRALATAALRGASVDWPAVLGGGRTVELPTYAFRRQRFWPKPVEPVGSVSGDDPFWAAVEAGDAGELAGALAVDDARISDLLPALAAYRRRERDEESLTDWRYRVVWTPVAGTVGATLTGRWLVLGADADTAAPAAALAAAGADVQVLPSLEPGSDTAGLTGIVSLLALDPSDGLPATLRLVQRLDDTAPLWVATRGGVATAPTEVTAPDQAQVWGLGRVVALEHPQRWGGLIDLPAHWDANVAARFVQALTGTEDQLALREQGLLARRLTRAGRPRTRKHWQARGTVLVTGGLGALGAHAARWATDRGAERVLLTAAGPLHRDVAVTAAGIAGAGGDVLVTRCDSQARSELSSVLRRTAGDGPELTAVIHADGVGQATPVAEMTEQELTTVSSTKVGSAALLDELTEDLDAFVVFSSIAATWGSARVGGYAAGNAFVEAIAERRRARGLPATTVAWGPWETGAGADQSVRHGLRTLDPALAMRALGQMLDGGEDALTIADVDWQRFAPAFTLHRPSPLVQELPEVTAALAEPVVETPASGTRWAELPPTRREQELTELVRVEAARVLAHSGPADVEPDRAFSALGFDSLTSVELRNRLTAATGVALPSTVVFQFPTPHELAVRICELIGGDSEAEGPDAVLAELDRLDEVLDGLLSEPGDAADRVDARLAEVVARWRERRGAPAESTSGVAGQLAAAGDEELYEFLGKEFGIQ